MLPIEVIEPLISAVAISMFLTPVLFLLHEKFIDKNSNAAQNKDADQIEKGDHKVILAGFGRLGTDVGRFLISAGIKPVILDHNADNVNSLRKFGFEVYFHKSF